MTDLTEQWKKGKLPEETKCYVRVNSVIYLGSIRYKNGCHNKKLPYVKSFNGQFITKHVEEILAEVPDYIEWKNMINCACEEHEANKRLIEENAELKELLKECRIYVKIETEDYDDRTVSKADKEEAKKLLTQIDEVLK
jgi:hypothetical protein